MYGVYLHSFMRYECMNAYGTKLKTLVLSGSIEIRKVSLLLT